MIPNCEGCQVEIEEAFKLQEMGFDVALENMGVREHCYFEIIENDNNRT